MCEVASTDPEIKYQIKILLVALDGVIDPE
jgi:hypothetical protein